MKVGIVTGTFDLLHTGHIHLLKQARKRCDYLIIALQVDPSCQRIGKNKPVESVLERQIKLNACRYVDFTVVYEKENDLFYLFKYFKIDVRFLGSDYEGPDGKPITAKEVIPVEFIDSLSIHTSDIRERIKNE